MAIASLGAGAGVLTSDIIDKLKAADTAGLITPIDNKVTLQTQKNSAIGLLNSLLTTFKSSVKALDDDALYQQRTVSGNTDSISVTATSGVAVQSMSISNTVMAQKEVVESGKFASGDSKVASGADGTMTLSMAGTDYKIGYTSSMTLNDLKDAITVATGGKITASTLQVGTNDTRLVLTSGTTGADQKITMSDSVGGSLDGALQQTDNIKSGLFSSTSDLVAGGATSAGTYNITMNNTNYSVAYDETTTFQQLADSINTAVGSNVASIGQSGSSYQLSIGSTATGEDSTLSVSDSGGFLDSSLTSGITNTTVSASEIQKASDSSFKYNGITITRPTNTISDVVVGVSINLLKDAGSANIGISQNVQAVSDELSSFVQSYNSLTSQLTSMTTTDTTAGKVGIFNGDSTINGITREINRLLTSVNSDGLALTQFGIDLDQTGTMTFNSSTFTTQFNKNVTLSEKFFSGMTSTNAAGNTTSVDGLFTSMSTLMDNYTKASGTMSLLTTDGTDQIKNLTDSKTKAQALLDARYATMTARFAQYDAMMTKLTNQFSSLEQQISMAANGTAS
ncbi:MAG: flagellar filament capping protein FliD [Sulfurimonas sp.]|jgi:flagellar hook-associated protein 2